MRGLVLFDIDKTLVKESTGHAEAFSEGFKKVYNLNASIEIITYSGMTDQQVIIEVLKKKGLKEFEILSKIGQCMEVMVEYFDGVKDSIEVEVFKGVPELLERLKNNGLLLGLLTGNLESIAKGKMEKANLNDYFKLGGFGSDGRNRIDLVKLAIERAEKNFGFKNKGNVFLFGDSPQDIKAGQEAGITSVGVATGIFTKEDLKNADYVVENLENTSKILEIVLKK